MNPGTILRNGTPSWWIELEAKDLRALRFDFGENDVENRNKLHDLLQKLAFENFDGLFCFKNPMNGNKNGYKWYSYDVKEEFKRMTSSLGADCQWKISSENEKFKICETYPPLLIGKVQKIIRRRIIKYFHNRMVPGSGKSPKRSRRFEKSGLIPNKKSVSGFKLGSSRIWRRSYSVKSAYCWYQ